MQKSVETALLKRFEATEQTVLSCLSNYLSVPWYLVSRHLSTVICVHMSDEVQCCRRGEMRTEHGRNSEEDLVTSKTNQHRTHGSL